MNTAILLEEGSTQREEPGNRSDQKRRPKIKIWRELEFDLSPAVLR